MLKNKISLFSVLKFKSLFIIFVFSFFSETLLAAEKVAKMDSGVNFVSAIAIAIVAASILVVIFYRLNQPQILAYLATGVILQFFSSLIPKEILPVFKDVAQLGAVFLFFIIGMEMRLKNMVLLGKGTLSSVILLVPATMLVTFIGIWTLAYFGFWNGGTDRAFDNWIFFAAALALSSTPAVMQHLADKKEVETRAGKITIATLLSQELWAVVILSYLLIAVGTNGENISFYNLLNLLLRAGAISFGIFFLFDKIIGPIFKMLGHSVEIVSFVGLGWCFLSAQAFHFIGLPPEVGALIAGISVGRHPAHHEVLPKILSLRDFFLAILFISLGITLPQLTWDIFIGSMVLVGFVLIAKILIFTPALLLSREGLIIAVVAAINLTQVGEFALKFVPLGYYQGFLNKYEFGVISYATLISIGISTYLIRYEYQIAFFINRVFGKYFNESKKEDIQIENNSYKVIFLGYHQNTTSLFQYANKSKNGTFPKSLVIDYRYALQDQIKSFGSDVYYGDISSPHTLEMAGVANAEVIVCCIDDMLLKGTSNLKLYETCKHINNDVKFIGTANDLKTEMNLLDSGVFAVLNPSNESAPALFNKINKAL